MHVQPTGDLVGSSGPRGRPNPQIRNNSSHVRPIRNPAVQLAPKGFNVLSSAVVISLCNGLSFASHGCTNPTDVSRRAGDYNFPLFQAENQAHTSLQRRPFLSEGVAAHCWPFFYHDNHDGKTPYLDACSRNQEVHSIAATKFAIPAPVPSASADASSLSLPSPGV